MRVYGLGYGEGVFPNPFEDRSGEGTAPFPENFSFLGLLFWGTLLSF